LADFILVDGDQAIFLPNFGPAVVAAAPGTLKGSGPAMLTGRNLCVEGDEKNVIVPGCAYFTPQYSIPGMGMLKIASLAPNQKAMKTKAGGKPVLLLGGMFTAEFTVNVPAMQPPPGPGSPIPDATPKYTGQGKFITFNIMLTGS
jgi:hypothetical protein